VPAGVQEGAALQKALQDCQGTLVTRSIAKHNADTGHTQLMQAAHTCLRLPILRTWYQLQGPPRDHLLPSTATSQQNLSYQAHMRTSNKHMLPKMPATSIVRCQKCLPPYQWLAGASWQGTPPAKNQHLQNFLHRFKLSRTRLSHKHLLPGV
jgi:hypothetical protein